MKLTFQNRYIACLASFGQSFPAQGYFHFHYIERLSKWSKLEDNAIDKPTFSPIEEFLTKTYQHNNDVFIGSGLLERGFKMLIFGPEKHFKSCFAQQIGFELSSGKPIAGLFEVPFPRKVCLLQCEIYERKFQDRLRKTDTAGWNRQDGVFFVKTDTNLRLDRDEPLRDLARELNQIRPDVLIIDPLYKIVTGSLSDDETVKPVFNNLDRLITMFDMAVILIHHKRKPKIDRETGKVVSMGNSDAMGSFLITAWPDTLLNIGGGQEALEVDFTVRNAEEEVAPINLILDRDYFILRNNPKRAYNNFTELLGKITAELPKEDDAKSRFELTAQLVASTGLHQRRIEQVMADMKKNNILLTKWVDGKQVYYTEQKSYNGIVVKPDNNSFLEEED